MKQMTFNRFLFALSIGISFTIIAQPQQFTHYIQPELEGFDKARLARLDSFILKNIEAGKVPNTVTFIAHNGKVIHHKAFGYKNIEKNEKVSVKTIFRSASQTKAITSMAVMILYERGYFLLNDPVSKYLPEFENMQVLDTVIMKDTTYKSHPAKNKITIRQLLSHSSGIMYDHVLAKKAKIPFFNSQDRVFLKDIMPKIAALPLLHEPGKAFTYGLNTDVLGYLVEKLSGKPLDQFFSNEIFKPLGMNDTYFYLPEEKKNRLVELYMIDSQNGKLKVSENERNRSFAINSAGTYFSGGAGLVGTIEDYAKFCQMILNGGTFNNHRILSRKTIETISTNQLGDKDAWNDNKFGLGFEIMTEKGIATQLGSLGALRWGGMFTTDYTIDPKEKLIILFYTNVNPNAYWDLNNLNRVLTYQALK